jgi:ankyrin repeat protein
MMMMMNKTTKNEKCLSLVKTKQILDTFCLFLQVCRHLVGAAESGDVNTTKRWAHCDSDSCTEKHRHHSTPLIIAALNGHDEVVRVLLEGGADVERGDVDMDTALSRAAVKGHLEVCRRLLDWGAKVNTVDRWKETALHDAVFNGHMSVAKLLVERGADVSLKDVRGRTAANMARVYGYTTLADWLDSVSRV